MGNANVVFPLTRLIHRDTNEYPVYTNQVIERYQGMSFPPVLTETLLDGLGYSVVDMVAPPQGDVVKETVPALSPTGRYIQNYHIRQFTPEEALANLNAAKKSSIERLTILFAAVQERGVPVTFTVDADGNPVTDIVRWRDDDVAALNTLANVASMMLLSGDQEKATAKMLPFRSKTNINYMLSPIEVTALISGTFEKAAPYQGKCWAIKDAIRSASDLSSIVPVDAMMEVLEEWPTQTPVPDIAIPDEYVFDDPVQETAASQTADSDVNTPPE